MDRKKRLSFVDSKIGSILFVIYFSSLLGSALPEWSNAFAAINLSIAFVATIIIFISWRRIENTKIYFSVASFCMILILALSSFQPIIKLFWDVNRFISITLIFSWIVFYIISIFLRKKIYQMALHPFSSKSGIIFHSAFFVFGLLIAPVLILGNIYIHEYREVDIELILLALFMYILSLFFIVTSAALLNKGEESK